MDAGTVGTFLRSRRRALQPEDVGLSRGPRRRADGLRREEVAELSGMSVDYYARLERGAGPQASEQMLTALARGLRLSTADRDHLFHLAGHLAPRQAGGETHVNPGLMRVLDRLSDTPAQVLGPLGETLAQTEPARALLGDPSGYTGMARSPVYRWFTDPAGRAIHPESDHALHGRTYVAQLSRAAALHGPGSAAAALARRLNEGSEEFRSYWSDQQVELRYTTAKRFLHPVVGVLDLHCQILLEPDQQQSLLIFTAAPGSEHAERLRLLTVLGLQRLEPDRAAPEVRH